MATTEDVPSYPMTRRCPFDPPPALDEIRTEEPIRRVRLWDGSTPWLVTRHADVKAVLVDPRFSAEITAPGYPPSSPGVKARREAAPTFISLDDPEHDRLRAMVRAAFTARRMEELRPVIAGVVSDQLDAMAAAGSPADLVAGFALPVPSMVICRMLGVPYDRHEFFQDRSRIMIDSTSTPEQAVEGSLELRDYLAGLVADRESAPTDDLLGRLAEHVSAGDLSRTDAASMGLLMLVAGHETTANMISLGTLRLLQEPEQAQRVRDGEPSEVARAVEELLRLLTVTHFGRRRAALADVEIGGVTIRAGDGVIAAGEAANRDPEEFEAPDRLDLDRDSNRHVAFGFGVHQCLGQHLARVELQVAYPALLGRFPGLRVTAPVEDLPFRDEMVVYGLHELPVAW